MNEIWKPVEGYDHYEVSNTGLVRNVITGRILSTWFDGYGYERVTLFRNGERYPTTIHQLVAEAFLEKEQVDIYEPVVYHKDRDRSHNDADNLEYITRAESTQRSFQHGRKQIHIMRKIRCVETGEEYDSIVTCSEAMGISAQAISRCVNNRISKTKDGFHFEPVD